MIQLNIDSQILQTIIYNEVKKALSELQFPPVTKADDIEYLNIIQAAELLKLKRQTIYQLVYSSKLKNYKNGKLLYFLKTDLLEYIHKGERKTHIEIKEMSKAYLKSKGL